MATVINLPPLSHGVRVRLPPFVFVASPHGIGTRSAFFMMWITLSAGGAGVSCFDTPSMGAAITGGVEET